MPLTIFPVPFLSDPNPKDKEQKPIAPAPSTRRAITLKLPIEVARALKDASANAKPGGQSAVRVTLNGDKPGLTISGQLFPFDLALKPTNGPNTVAELYSRTRHQYPRKPADHRPPLTLQSVIVGNAVVEDAAQKLRDRMAEAGQAKKDRRIQVLEMPPTTSGAGSKASAATTKKKKNAAARTATASTLERDVLRKGVAMKATTTAPAASSSMSAPSSNRASPSTINHKQPSSSTPTSPVTSPVDTRPLEERIIHLLATKSQTIQELESLLGANKDDISEILRRVATTHDQSSTSGNWTSTPKGPWALKLNSYASLQPWTWPAYTDRDRKRIAADMENAFDQSGLPRSAPERLSLQEGEAKWKKKQAAKAASGASVPGTAQRKLKMKKMSEPPNATGGTLSASSVKQGMVKSTSANGVSTAPVKKKVPKADGTGSSKGSDVEMKERPKKRPSPTETSNSGAATPMSASSSHGSISSGTSASAPLRHSLPPKPQVNLGPPSSATQHVRRTSHTPPPPRPSATPTQSPRPTGSAASPRAAPSTSKRKYDDMSDMDDVVMSGKTKSARPPLPASSSSSSTPLEAKRRKHEPSPLGAGSSTAAISRTTSASTVVNGAVAKTKHDESVRDPSKASSSSQAHQNLKPPQTNGRPSQAPSRSASVATAKSDRETASLPKFGKKEPSPLGPSALSKGVNGRDKVSSSARTDERSHSRASGKGRATPVFTSSSEEEEDPEEAAEAARRAAAKKKKKLALAAAAAATPAASSPSNAPRLRKIKRLPSPLPTDRKELRLLHGEKYAEMMTAFAEIQAEKARAERCAAQQGDPSTLWSEDETRAKVNEYNTLHEQVAKIREAVDVSIRAEGQE
ncbi:hypothetical protein FS837_008456 [Tulasnella sp. UAMH 9824]|nr:hypothetical protein FS837_008456 [Tulasnella sp. UAMH 9824]